MTAFQESLAFPQVTAILCCLLCTACKSKQAVPWAAACYLGPGPPGVILQISEPCPRAALKGVSVFIICPGAIVQLDGPWREMIFCWGPLWLLVDCLEVWSLHLL